MKVNDAVERLAHARHVETVRKEFLARRETELRATPLWRQWELASGGLKAAKANVANAEIEVRKRAMKVFAETGDRIPHPAIRIKMYMALDYDDDLALEYAREHLPQALKLIKRTFEKAAKVLELDFVTIWQEPRATIARDLSKYLPRE